MQTRNVLSFLVCEMEPPTSILHTSQELGKLDKRRWSYKHCIIGHNLGGVSNLQVPDLLQQKRAAFSQSILRRRGGLTYLSGCLAGQQMGRLTGPSLTAAPSVKQRETGSDRGN